MLFAKVRAGKTRRLKHRGFAVSGDVVPVRTCEMYSFGDKLVAVDVKATDEAAQLMYRFELKVADVKVADARKGIIEADVLAVLKPEQLAKLKPEPENGGAES